MPNDPRAQLWSRIPFVSEIRTIGLVDTPQDRPYDFNQDVAPLELGQDVKYPEDLPRASIEKRADGIALTLPDRIEPIIAGSVLEVLEITRDIAGTPVGIWLDDVQVGALSIAWGSSQRIAAARVIAEALATRE